MSENSQSPLAKTARLLDLVPYLLSHQNISLRRLSEEFGRTEKEMIDDLNTLWMCGLPGYTPLELIDLSFESGVVSISNADPLKQVRSLSVEEIIALILGLDILEASLDLSHIDALENIAELKRITQQLVGEIARISPSSFTPVLSSLQVAIEQRKEVSFNYLSSLRDKLSERRVAPLRTYSERGFDYVETVSFEDHEFRTFRCDRISNLVIGDQMQEISGELSRESHHATILISNNLRAVSEQLSIGSLEPKDESGSIATIQFFSPLWLERMVLASAGDIEILEPSSLREQVKKSAEIALSLYSQGS